MMKNNMLLLLHPSNRHGEEKGRFKTKKYYHQVIGPVWLPAVTEEDYYYDYYYY